MRVFRSRGCIFAVLILLGLWICPVSFAQTNASVPTSEPTLTAEQLEFQKKLGAATAKVQQDPEVIQASRKAMKALRDADRLMYEKIRQFDPSLSEYVEQALKTLPKEAP